MRSTSCRASSSRLTAPRVGGCNRSGTTSPYTISIIATPNNSNSSNSSMSAIYNSLATIHNNFSPSLASSSTTYRQSRHRSPLRLPAPPLPSSNPTIPSLPRLSITTTSLLSGAASLPHLPPRLSGSWLNRTRHLTNP